MTQSEKFNPAPYLAEFLTGIFILMGAGATIAAEVSGNVNSIGIAAVHGGTIMVLVAMFGKISGGHFNPMVTWAAVLRRAWKRDFGPLKGAGYFYILAQLVGAATGALILYGVFLFIDGGTTAVDKASLGTPALKEGVNVWAGFGLEMFFGFVLALVILRTAIEENSPMAPLWIGGTVFILAVSPLGALTGAAMNPARWLGPALVSGTWDNWWIYAFAPVVGATFAVIINDIMSRSKSPSPV